MCEYFYCYYYYYYYYLHWWFSVSLFVSMVSTLSYTCKETQQLPKKGEVATTSLEFEYLHGKRRWEILIGRYDINNDVITLGTFLMFVYIFLLFLLFADWGKSDSSVDGERQASWRWNSNSRDVISSSPGLSRPAARAPRRACSRAMPNSILDCISDFKFSTQLVSTVVVAAITVFQVRFEFLAAAWVL